MTKRIIYITLAAYALMVLTMACGKRQQKNTHSYSFTIDVINGYTPVKNQGLGRTCWIYAMLATIETDRITLGDSVNLSADYTVRRLMEEQYNRAVLTGGTEKVWDSGTAPDLLRLIDLYGAMPFNSYCSSKQTDDSAADSHSLTAKTMAIARKAINSKADPEKYFSLLSTLLDSSLGSLPPHVYMLGAQYTPEEFGRSVALSSDYEALTSFAHHHYNTYVDLELPDNRHHNMFFNVTLDSLVCRIRQAVTKGYGVCWEGDISEPGFSFRRGVAVMPKDSPTPTDMLRKKEFLCRHTTDDHCMAIIGMAHDKQGQTFYIMKNSWGRSNAHKGLIYMSEDYLRMKTIAIVTKRDR